METGLKGRVALVCAASRGLGKAAARGLAAEGARVAMCARHMPTLEAAAAEIQAETGADVLAVGADVSRRADIVRLVDQTVRHFGRLDILVTNSGGPKPGLFSATTESDWRDAIDLVLMSTVLLCMEAVPHMRRAGGGRGAGGHVRPSHADTGGSCGGDPERERCRGAGHRRRRVAQG